MEIHLKASGIALILLAFLHSIFPKYFNWKKELKGLSLVNRQMMQIHTFFIALTVFLMGLLSFCLSEDLVLTALGQKLCVGIGVFWSIRGALQFVGYSSKLWKGKTFETIVHIALSEFWVYLSLVYFKIGLS